MMPTRSHRCVVCGGQEHSVVASGTDYQYHTVDETFSWCRCTACGHFYINPIPTEAALGIIYPDTLKNYDEFDSRPEFGVPRKESARGPASQAAGRWDP